MAKFWLTIYNKFNEGWNVWEHTKTFHEFCSLSDFVLPAKELLGLWVEGWVCGLVGEQVGTGVG